MPLKYCDTVTVHGMSWYPVLDINVAADKSVQTAVNITLLLIKCKIMTTSVNGLQQRHNKSTGQI